MPLPPTRARPCGALREAVGLLGGKTISLTSSRPPYRFSGRRAYTDLDEREDLDWMLRLAETWMPELASNSSVVLNLSDAWRSGEPTLSFYQER